MIYISFAILAAGPIGIALVFWLIIIGRATAPYWRPFAFNEPLGQRRNPSAPAAAFLPPLPTPTQGAINRLHVGAAIFALLAAAALALFVLSSEAFLFPGCTEARMSCFGDWVAYQLGPLALLASIPFALIYLRRMWQLGVDGAEHLALAVWTLPRLAFVATTALAASGGVADTGDGWAGTAAIAALVLVGVSIVARWLRLRLPLGKHLPCIASSAAIAVLAVAMFAEPLLLMIDGFLSAIAIGYGIYRMRARAGVFDNIPQPINEPLAPGIAERTHEQTAPTSRYRITVLAIVAFAASVAIATQASPQELIAHPWALFGVAQAAALGTYLVARLRDSTQSHDGDASTSSSVLADAVIAFVAVATAGAVMRLIDYGGFDDVGNGDVYGWVLPAIVGSTTLLASALFGRWQAMRPFLLATVWPLLIAYCAIGSTSGEWEVSRSGTATVAALSIGTLWAMWYAFAPPRPSTASMAIDARTLEQTSLRPTTSQV